MRLRGQNGWRGYFPSWGSAPATGVVFRALAENPAAPKSLKDSCQHRPHSAGRARDGRAPRPSFGGGEAINHRKSAALSDSNFYEKLSMQSLEQCCLMEV